MSKEPGSPAAPEGLAATIPPKEFVPRLRPPNCACIPPRGCVTACVGLNAGPVPLKAPYPYERMNA